MSTFSTSIPPSITPKDAPGDEFEAKAKCWKHVREKDKPNIQEVYFDNIVHKKGTGKKINKRNLPQEILVFFYKFHDK